MKKPEETNYVRAQGVPFLIIAVVVMTTSLVLWRNEFDLVMVSAIFAFGLFLVACGVQSFASNGISSKPNRNPISLFIGNKIPLIVGLIPLIYAVAATLYIAPTKIRAFIIFFILFSAIIFSYLRDFFRPKKPEERDRIDKFYEKTADAEDALGLARGLGDEDIATRRVTVAKKASLLGAMLRVAPWQLIAAFILAIAFQITMIFL